MTKLTRPVKVVSFVILITVIAKLLGFLRIIFMAKAFGTGMEASAFEAAYRVPELLFTSIGIALSTTFIPIFMEYKSKKNEKEAILFANNVINILLIIALIISAIGVIFAPIIVKLIYQGFEGNIYYLTVNLVRILFPIIIFIALSFSFVAILQSFGEFNVPASISIPANIINILYLILFSSIWGIYGFAIAVLIGWSAQFLIQIPSLIKKGYFYKFTFSLKDEKVKKMFIMVIPIIIGTSVHHINLLVNSALASNLGNGAVSSLGYANYLFIIIVGIFTYAITAVLFPSLSRMHAIKDYDSLKKTINSAIKVIFFILAPIATGIIILKVPLIKVLLERGEFDAQSIKYTSSVLLFFAFGMIGFGIQELLNKTFFALHNTKTPMKVALFGIALNIILSLILINYLELGGLALSASISITFIAVLLLYKLSKTLTNIFEQDILKSLFKIIFASIFMGISVSFIYKLFDINVHSSFSNSLISLITCIACGAFIYYFCTLILKINEATIVLDTLKNKLKKTKKERI